MRRCLAFLSTLLFVSVCTAEDAPPRDGDEFDGVWLAQSAALGGKPLPADFLAKATLTLKSGHYSVNVDGNQDKGTFQADATTDPRQITFSATEGPNKGHILQAIYQRIGDDLLICYGLGGTRPTDFSSRPDTQDYLVRYSRKPK
jgi:uncharacterized protein (TIGR03067 family)